MEQEDVNDMIAKNPSPEAEIQYQALASNTPVFLNSVTDHPDVQRLIGQVVQLQIENKELKKAMSEAIVNMNCPAVVAEGEWIKGMFCGLEDRDITDRYDACLYGYNRAIEKVNEWVIEILEEVLAINEDNERPTIDEIARGTD